MICFSPVCIVTQEELLACVVWLDAARAVTTTGNVRVTLASAVGNPELDSHANDCSSICDSSAPATPCVQPCIVCKHGIREVSQ